MTQVRLLEATRGIIPYNADEKRIIPFVLSTATRDRHHTILNQDHWELANYKKNPIVSYAHTISGGLFTDPNPDYIIGRSRNLRFEGSGANKKLIADCEFEPASVNPLAEKIFQKCLFGSLNSASVGFIEVGQGSWGQGKEARGGENEIYYFEGQELIEWSIVNVPSNPQAGKREASRRVCDSALGVQAYALKELGDIFRPSQLDPLTMEEIQILLEAKELGTKETDINKILKNMRERYFRQVQLVADDPERFSFGPDGKLKYKRLY